MCCNYCPSFSKCKKLHKTNPKCCSSCVEFDFCPLINGKNKSKSDHGIDYVEHDRRDDIGMLDDELY